jgi:hypothetical protein
MAPSNLKAVVAGAREAAIETVKLTIPIVGPLIESFRKYRESIEDQQREAFIAKLAERASELEKNADWYRSAEAKDFTKKVVATALNAEYADKIEFLANAFANGPKLGNDDSTRAKFVEMIRQLSKPALEVLVASLENPNSTGQIMPGELAVELQWSPELVDACVHELHAIGAFSSTKSWTMDDGIYHRSGYSSQGSPLHTSLTSMFAAFVSR